MKYAVNVRGYGTCLLQNIPVSDIIRDVRCQCLIREHVYSNALRCSSTSSSV